MIIKGLQKMTLLDFPGKIACTVFLGGCNFRCPFCHNGALALGGAGGDDISVDALLAFLDQRRGRLQGVCISGGEPTLQEDLPELIAEIKARGFKVKLDTNGTNPEMLYQLICDGLVDYVAMDIKNSPEKYPITAAAPLDFSAVESSVALLKQGRVDYEFRTTLVKELHTTEDIEAIGKWLSGSKRHFLQTYREEGDLIVGGFTAFTKDESEAAAEILRKYIPSVSVR